MVIGGATCKKVDSAVAAISLAFVAAGLARFKPSRPQVVCPRFAQQ